MTETSEETQATGSDNPLEVEVITHLIWDGETLKFEEHRLTLPRGSKCELTGHRSLHILLKEIPH